MYCLLLYFVFTAILFSVLCKIRTCSNCSTIFNIYDSPNVCSKTPQTPTLSKRGFPKTPVGTTPNQRRKTWCHTEPDDKSRSVGTPRRSGILKHGHGKLTSKQTKRKSCSFIRNKENLSKLNANIMSHTSGDIIAAVQEEKVLIQSLKKCYEMFMKVLIILLRTITLYKRIYAYIYQNQCV